MNPKALTDHELHRQIKQYVNDERHLLTKILHHLAEVERRKLFCDFGCRSLFEYAVKELGYSEGQAGRRIQAMRLIKEIPAVEKKITSGKLSLSNISQAQSFFKDATKANKPINMKEKIEILTKLENKSCREGQKELLSLMPERPLPKEKERIISETHIEVSFVMDTKLKQKLEEVRSLMGPKGATMELAALVDWMAQTSIEALKVKRFGKKRALQSEKVVQKAKVERTKDHPTSTPAPECKHTSRTNERRNAITNPRYVSDALRHHVWMRDKGQCTKCGSRRHLNIDHIKPVALGGESTPENLRLLCF